MGNIAQVLSNAKDKLQDLDNRYGDKLKEIAELQKELASLPSLIDKKGKEWVANKQDELNKKIEDKMSSADAWLEFQKDKVQKWMNERKDQLTKELKDKAIMDAKAKLGLSVKPSI